MRPGSGKVDWGAVEQWHGEETSSLGKVEFGTAGRWYCAVRLGKALLSSGETVFRFGRVMLGSGSVTLSQVKLW